ncbi:MAG: hypothetical protein H7330_03565 [Hymenobacteraceae bacterium]|nr:hypothetical protein [Hymenobacteraceae bacterium]
MKHLSSILLAVARPFLLLLGGCLLMAPGAHAQGFNVPGGGFPAGWTLSDDPDGGDDVSQVDHFRLEAGLNVALENIVTASYNLSGYTGVTFTVDVSRFSTGAPNPLTVEVSTNGGANFTQTYTAAAPTSNSYSSRTYNIATVSAITVLRLTNQGTGGRGVKLQNLVLSGTAPIISTIATGTISGSPFCVGASGAAVSVPYTITGSYTAGNVFTAQLSDATGSFASSTNIGSVTATTAGTIPATLPNSIGNGTGYRIRVVSSTPGVTGTDNGANLTITNANTVMVAGLSASPSNAQIALQWTNPTSCFDAVLVIARAGAPVSAVPSGAAAYSANATFGSGTAVQPGEFVVYNGTGTAVTVTGLTNGTTYHFAVFSRRGTVYGPGVTISDVPTAGPALTEVFVPRYLAARPIAGTTHINRLPYAFRVMLTGLLPNTTYRYANRAVGSADNGTVNGYGNAIYPAAGGYTRVVSSNALILSPLSAGYNTLVTAANGTFTGWFVLEPTADARFNAGELLRMRILLNDGTASDVVATRLNTVSTATALLLGASAADGTGIVDSSLAVPRNFVLLYDNEAGTGRPLAATFVESDGSPNTTANGYTGFYATRVEAKAGKWGTIIPNTNAAGVRRIEQRALADGAIVGCVATDADGVWSSLASTVNPTGGASPVVLSAVDAPLACGVFVGMNPSTQSQPEGNSGITSVPIRITVNTAPATALMVQVSNAGGGTATVGTDYLFNTQTITFPTSGTYPMTLTVNAQFVGDVVVESNEAFNLNLTVISGTATVLQVPGRMVIADDDFLASGLIINEISKGPSGQQEYVELLVTGTPGSTVDLRGWTLDDNNGAFSGGGGNNVGINDGHFRFDNHCTWEKVRVGSIIVLYNEASRNSTLPPTDDPTDADLDFLYVVPVLNTGTCGVVTGASSDYLEGNCDVPNSSSAAYPAATVGPRWNQIGLNSNGDAIQLRQPAGPEPTLHHGLSFASNSNSAINSVNHPDYALKGANALFFLGANQTYYFDNTDGNDFRSKANWLAQAGGGQETPGTPNTVRNGQFIESLRLPLVPTSTTASYTCDVRPEESRAFLDASNRLMLRVSNESTTNYGSVLAETVVGSNSHNISLDGQPYFLGKEYRVTPTTSSPANYVVTFYVTDAELDSYAGYVSGQTNQTRSAAFLRPRLQIYKNSGNVLPSMAPDNLTINIASAVVGSYSSGVTTYSATFTSFSTFAIGASEQDVLPVELTRLSATAASNHAARVDWATASEANAATFEVQRSADGLTFTAVGAVAAHGTSAVSHAYSFLDGKPLAGVAYYRLRQIDADGKSHLSDIVSVRLGAAAATTLEAWPVPMGAELHLRLTAPASGAATVRLLDLQGRIVVQRLLVLTAGSTELTLPTDGLRAGTYVAETLLPGGGVVRTKVLK